MKILIRWFPWILVAALLLVLSFWMKLPGLSGFLNSKDSTVITHNMIVERIEAMGKLELTKYYIKDVIEHEKKVKWGLDRKAVLIISGEVVGCVDLKKVDSTMIKVSKEKIIVTLPYPEICYSKINHDQSKVYSIANGLFEMDKSGLIDEAYKLAESNLTQAALKMGIYEQTKANAKVVLKPLLEQVGGKPVEIVFAEPANPLKDFFKKLNLQ
ncbi:MAG: DUF4230 domain-containing protein [Cytophagaceae bacterium]|nr:DUF4230 domain-containing protein [Cytophagaceae bacterium]MDW8457277.1 DUF4230 domain-containing protein [Cytophagaceae bacterium]